MNLVVMELAIFDTTSLRSAASSSAVLGFFFVFLSSSPYFAASATLNCSRCSVVQSSGIHCHDSTTGMSNCALACASCSIVESTKAEIAF